MTPALSPEDLLAEARRLIDEAPPGTVSVWPRAAALLARQALEGRLERFWWQTAPGVERLNMRAQLNCLRAYASPSLASDFSYTWHALSRVTHHRPYALDPTRDELSSLLGVAERLVAAFRATTDL